MDDPIDDFVTGTQLKIEGNRIQTKYGGARYKSHGSRKKPKRDNNCERINRTITTNNINCQHGGQREIKPCLPNSFIDDPPCLDDNSGNEVKKIDGWLKDRTDNFVFDIKSDNENIFDEARKLQDKCDDDHVMDLFTTSSEKTIDVNSPFSGDIILSSDRQNKDNLVNMFLNQSTSSDTSIQLLEVPSNSLIVTASSSSNSPVCPDSSSMLEKSLSTRSDITNSSLNFSTCHNVGLTYEERACLEELERGSQLSQEEQEMLENSKKEFELNERDTVSIMAHLENLPEGLGLVFEPTSVDSNLGTKEISDSCEAKEDLAAIRTSEKEGTVENIKNTELPVVDEELQKVAIDLISFATQKMQILVNTSQGQQIYEINTDNSTVPNSIALPVTLVPEVGVSTTSEVLPTIKLQTVVESSVEQDNNTAVDGNKNEKNSINKESEIKEISNVNQINEKQKCSLLDVKQKSKKKHNQRIQNSKEDIERPFKCPVENCEWAFEKEYRLRRHLETHKKKKNYACDYKGCSSKFTTIYNLNTHKKLHRRPDSFLCPAKNCGQLFPTRRKMEDHLRIHKEIEAPYKCPYSHCGKEYYCANLVASHVRIHKYSEEDFKCPYNDCRKVFNRICRLKQHLRYHTGEKPYVCEYEGCGWTFINSSKLNRHMQTHTGERRYICPHQGCGKSFMRLEHVKGHMISHTGDKPFICPHENCNARFAAKSSLYVHVKKHSDTWEKMVYPCPIASCVKKYNCKASLRLHMLKIHSSILEGGQNNPVTVLSSKEIQEIASTLPQDLPDVIPLSVAASMFSTTSPQNTIVGAPSVILTEPLGQLFGGMITADVLTQQHGNSITAQLVINPDLVSSSGPLTTNNSVSAAQSLSTIVNTISSNDLEMIASARILQENNSGSARTDYCSNHILSSRAKKWWSLQQQMKTNLVNLTDIIKQMPDPNQILQDTSPNISSDVMLASTPVPVTFHDNISGTQFVETYLLPDDPPPSSDIYHDDHILTPVTSSSLISELAVPVSLLTATSMTDGSLNTSTTDFETITSGDTEFTGSTINLQDLE